MKVKFTPNDIQRNQYMDLTPHNVYMFTVIDTQWPEDWIEITHDGEYRATSKLFAEPGSFERVFDGGK